MDDDDPVPLDGTARLVSARVKLKRAKHHLTQINRDLAENPYGISFEHETKSDDLVIRAVLPPRLFVHLSLLAGEVVHHARSALEHAVWEMVPNPVEGKTGFPVDTNERHYDEKGHLAVKGINTEAAALIRGLQPFGSDRSTNKLYLLNELWKRDKHRSLSLVYGQSQAVAVLYAYPGGEIRQHMVNIPAGVEHGAVLFRAKHPGPEVDVEAEAVIGEVAFVDAGPASGQGIDLLTRLLTFAEGVVVNLVATLK